MKYSDYSFYISHYTHGADPMIPNEKFNRYATHASHIINQHTFGAVDQDNPMDEVKMACCAIAEVLFEADSMVTNGTFGVTSEHVGDLSVTYASGSEKKAAADAKINDCIYTYLSNTGLLYCGRNSAC